MRFSKRKLVLTIKLSVSFCKHTSHLIAARSVDVNNGVIWLVRLISQQKLVSIAPSVWVSILVSSKVLCVLKTRRPPVLLLLNFLWIIVFRALFCTLHTVS